jgi:5-methylcytosine-specific restriction protein A
MNVLPRQCAEPGCPGKTFDGSRCPRHAGAWRNGRPASAYGSGWSKLRARVLAEEPTCACGAPATEVDHIVALAFGGSHDRGNLRGTCTPCHKRKTAEDSRRGRARKREGAFSRPRSGKHPGRS